MTIFKESLVPLHIQLADLLRSQVLGDQLRPNHRLPSERELCEKYQISRITVRKALSTLAQEGLVRSAAGKGTFVVEPAFNEELLPLSSITQDLQRRGLTASSRVLEAVLASADDELATRLNLPRGSEVVRLVRLRLANQVLPIAVQTTHLPHCLCPGLLEIDFTDCSLYDVLRQRFRLALAHSSTVILATLAQPKEAALLQLKEPAAVLISDQTTFLDSGAVIEITRSVFHSEHYTLHFHS
jgi:GntR family transcriptional regulator